MATRWGIASAGKISHDFCTALGTLPKNEHEIVAVAARDTSRAKEFAALHGARRSYGSYEELAKDEDVEIVYIGTLNPQHFEVSKLMLDNGKHVLCEKPLTLNSKQCSELIALAKSKNLFLMEAVWSRCFPIYDVIKKELESGSIGDVLQIVASFGLKLDHVERVNSRRHGGGTILDLGVYLLQFASFIFNGEEPTAIKAAGHLNEDGVDVSASAILIYKNNGTATILTHSLVQLDNEAKIIGTKGTIKVPDFWCPTKVELPTGKIEIHLPKGAHPFNFTNSAGLRYEAAEVRSCLKAGLKESQKVSHHDSQLLVKLEDEFRRQVGVVFPED